MRWTGGAVVILFVLAAIVVGGLLARLSMGPISIDGLSQRVAQALAERMGPSWSVKVAGAVIDHTGAGPTLRLTDVDVRNPAGLRVLHSGAAEVSVGSWELLSGRVVPKSIEFADLDLRLTVSRDGGLAFTAADEPAAPAPPSAVPSQVDVPAPAGVQAPTPLPLAVATASLIDLLATRDGVFGALDRVALTDAKLTLVNADRRPQAVFTDVSLRFERPKATVVRFSFGLSGRTGPWSLSGYVKGLPGEERAAVLSLKDVPISDVLLLGGLTSSMVTTDMPLSGDASVTIASDGRLKAFEAGLSGAASVVHVDDPDMPPIKVDRVAIATAWDAAAGEMVLHSVSFAAGRTVFNLAGRLSPGPEGTPWKLSLAGQQATLEGFGPNDPDLAIATVDATLAGVAGGGMVIERLAVSGQGFGVALSGSLGTAADAGGLRIGLSTARSSVRPVLRLWPVSIAPDVRRYLVENLRSGIVDELTVSVSLSGEELRAAQQKQPVPDKAVKIDFALSDTEFWPTETLPPLTRASARGSITGHSATVRVASATIPLRGGRSLGLQDGFFSVPDTVADQTKATVDFRLSGGAEGIGAFLAHYGKTVGVSFSLGAAKIAGTTDLKVSLAMPLSKALRADEVKTRVTGTLSNLSIDPIFGSERLEGGTLTLSQDQNGLQIKGDGKIGGLPATIDVREPVAGGPGEAAVVLTLDEAARARRGLSFGKRLAGPVVVRMSSALVREGAAPPRFEVDLTRAAIDGLLPNWGKPAGKVAKLAFALTEEKDGYSLDDMVLEGGGITAKGSVDLRADGSLEGAQLTQLKLSPGDDIKVDVDRTKANGFRLTVRGNVLDARPFLRMLAGAGDGKADESGDLDLDLAVNIVTGHNDEALSNVVLKLARRGKDLRDLQLAGRFGKAPVSAQSLRRDGGQGSFVVQSADAGSALRFMDFYKRLVGGDLVVEIPPADGQQNGSLLIRDFALRGEPALKRIIAEQPTNPLSSERGPPTPLPVDANEVAFTKLKADFARASGRLNIRDAVIWGPQIGISVQGYLDTARDRVDLSGTYVPAYALNNIFSQVPIVGTILGGGQYEGLFAVNFRVAGPASAPSMTINPLSAVAPGIFRKFFNAGKADGGQPLRPTTPER